VVRGLIWAENRKKENLMNLADGVLNEMPFIKPCRVAFERAAAEARVCAVDWRMWHEVARSDGEALKRGQWWRPVESEFVRLRHWVGRKDLSGSAVAARAAVRHDEHQP
jgi:hypothetical protein